MSKRIDLLSGSIAGPLTKLALPIMGTSLIQMAYNMVDMIWVGRVGADAVAAVGAAGMFMWLSTGLVILARMGGQVYTAQKLGAGDVKEAARYTKASLQMGTFFALIYTLIIVCFSKQLIAFFQLNSQQVVNDAVTYLWIVGIGMFSSFMNQILTSIITTTGNSKTPFVAMTTGLVFNIILDPVLIFGIGPFPVMGVAGAAWATVLAQVVVTVLFGIYMKKDDHLFKHIKLFGKPEWGVWKAIIKLGIPSAAQSCLFPMISMIIARLIASWGDDAVAVQKVGSQIESVSWMMADGFAVAVNSFIAQNFGAGNFKRAKKGYRVSMLIATVWGAFCTMLLLVFGGMIFKLFIPDSAILPKGTDYLTILAFSQLFLCWEIITAGAYSGFGHTLTPSVISIVFTAMRIPAAMLLSATALGLNGIWWSISISSIIKGILLVSAFALFLKKKHRNT